MSRACTEAVARRFATVEVAETVRCADCMPYEAALEIRVARGPAVPIDRPWPEAKRFE